MGWKQYLLKQLSLEKITQTIFFLIILQREWMFPLK